VQDFEHGEPRMGGPRPGPVQYFGSLATVARSTLPADERLTSLPDGQFEVLQRPYNQVSGVAHAHLHAVLRDRHDIDLVHDHVEVVGLAVLAAAALAPGIPPVLHTLHWT
jgi:hypothetical protein